MIETNDLLWAAEMKSVYVTFCWLSGSLVFILLDLDNLQKVFACCERVVHSFTPQKQELMSEWSAEESGLHLRLPLEMFSDQVLVTWSSGQPVPQCSSGCSPVAHWLWTTECSEELAYLLKSLMETNFLFLCLGLIYDIIKSVNSSSWVNSGFYLLIHRKTSSRLMKI